MRKDENAATAYAMYELVRDYILKICISTPSIKGKIVICGGIQINMSYPCEDFFEPLLLEVYENGTKTIDLLPAIENEIVYYELLGREDEE